MAAKRSITQLKCSARNGEPLRILLAVCTSLFLLLASGGYSATFPDGPITVVCWSNPGSPNDQLARIVARVGEKYFGERINVLTKKGGSGALAMAHLSRQRGDGHTLSTTTSSQLVNMASGRIPFQPEQFTYIMRITTEPFLIAVRTSSSLRTLSDFFNHAEKHPGQLTISGFGAVSAHFLAFSRLNAKAGDQNIRWIPYEGGTDAVVACLGGHTDAVHTNYAAVAEHVRSGTMRVLGVSSDTRLPGLPDTPTYREQGYDVSVTQWRGVMGPAALSEETTAQIREYLEETVADPEFHSFLQKAHLEPATMERPAVFQEWVTKEVDAYRRLMLSLGLLRGH